MDNLDVTPYNWTFKDNQGVLNIHIWGWNAFSEPVLLRILNYTATIYLELPEGLSRPEQIISDLDKVPGLTQARVVEKYKLYYYAEKKTFFCKLDFVSLEALHSFTSSLKKSNFTITGIPVIVRESEISPIRKLLTERDLNYSQTFNVTGVLAVDKISTLSNEYIVDYKTLVSTGEPRNIAPKVFSFRARTNNQGAIQSINVLVQSSEVKSYDLESKVGELDLFQQFFTLIQTTDPDIIIGYEIFTKAYPYFAKRLTVLGASFPALGRLRGKDSVITKTHWKSSAFGHNESHILSMEGRLSIDLHTFIKRTTKLDKYDYWSVIAEFNLPVTESLRDENGNILELFNKLDVWIELTELSNIVGVGVDDLFSRGEQIRSFSLIYDKATKMGYVIDHQPQPEIDVEGGLQFATEPGVYDKTLWFDFASEYPSVIISNNIDYTTLVQGDEKIPESDLNIIVGTNKGAVFGTKFVKSNIRKGVLPSLISELIDARNATKELIRKTGSIRYIKREKILKITTNAVTGFLGVPGDEGMLSLIQAFMTVTYIGRNLTTTTNEFLVDNYNAKILYNDTDSIAMQLPEEMSVSALYEIGEKIGTEVTALFPRPITLKFDGLNKFVLLTAKKYAILRINPDGTFGEESVKKGVLSVRSDTNQFSADIFVRILDNILYEQPVLESILLILDAIEHLIKREVSIAELSQVNKINTDYGPKSTYFLKKFLDRMESLGIKISKGTEIEFVVLEGLEKAKGDRMMLVSLLKRDDQYDVLYYIDSLVNPLDQILAIGYRNKLVSTITRKAPRKRNAIGLNQPVMIMYQHIATGGKLQDLLNWFTQNLS